MYPHRDRGLLIMHRVMLHYIVVIIHTIHITYFRYRDVNVVALAAFHRQSKLQCVANYNALALCLVQCVKLSFSMPSDNYFS